MAVDPSLASESYCYLTTTGRVSGKPREIEIWFGLDGDTLYMLSGGGERSDWVKNLTREPQVTVRIGDQSFEGSARIVVDQDEDARARRLLLETLWRYAPQTRQRRRGRDSLGSAPMEDLGAPASYLTLAEGMPVYSSDGEELGKIEHVLADPDLD